MADQPVTEKEAIFKFILTLISVRYLLYLSHSSPNLVQRSLHHSPCLLTTLWGNLGRKKVTAPRAPSKLSLNLWVQTWIQKWGMLWHFDKTLQYFHPQYHRVCPNAKVSLPNIIHYSWVTSACQGEFWETSSLTWNGPKLPFWGGISSCWRASQWQGNTPQNQGFPHPQWRSGITISYPFRMKELAREETEVSMNKK